MILSGFISLDRRIKKMEIKESGKMNSVVSFLASFVFGLHLVMNPWRLVDIVSSLLLFYFVYAAGLFTISKGVFLNLEEYGLRKGKS